MDTLTYTQCCKPQSEEHSIIIIAKYCGKPWPQCVKPNVKHFNRNAVDLSNICCKLGTHTNVVLIQADNQLLRVRIRSNSNSERGSTDRVHETSCVVYLTWISYLNNNNFTKYGESKRSKIFNYMLKTKLCF